MGRILGRRGLRVVAALAAGMGLAGCVSVPDGVTPVTGFDVERYMELGTKSRGSTIGSNAGSATSPPPINCRMTAAFG